MGFLSLSDPRVFIVNRAVRIDGIDRSTVKAKKKKGDVGSNRLISETHPPRLKQRRPSPLMTANGPQHGSSTRGNQAASNKRENPSHTEDLRVSLALPLLFLPPEIDWCQAKQTPVGLFEISSAF